MPLDPGPATTKEAEGCATGGNRSDGVLGLLGLFTLGAWRRRKSTRG